MIPETFFFHSAAIEKAFQDSAGVRLSVGNTA